MQAITFYVILLCALTSDGVNSQSVACQNAYNSFQSLSTACRTALGFNSGGNPLDPLRRGTFSDSNLDTLCSSSCVIQFTSYFGNCITQGSIPGTAEFISGTFDPVEDTEMRNAICRKDCATSETYCYNTVISTLTNTVCDSSTSTCSSSCQTALDNGGCCAQAVFKFKNPSVETTCSLCSFLDNCVQFTRTCPADATCSGTIAQATTTAAATTTITAVTMTTTRAATTTTTTAVSPTSTTSTTSQSPTATPTATPSPMMTEKPTSGSWSSLKISLSLLFVLVMAVAVHVVVVM